MKRSVEDYQRDLRKQLGRLRRNGEAYDQGDEDAALDLAVAIRVLVHETPNSDSVLGPKGLGVLGGTHFLNTRLPEPPARPGTQVVPVAGSSLLRIEMTTGPTRGTGIAFRPVLGSRPHRWVGFDLWWTEPVSHGSRATERYSRQDFVKAIAHKEGGAHVDPTISELYRAVAIEMGYGAAIDEATGEAGPFDSDPTFAAIRQIAYEVEQTIVTKLGKYLPGPDSI